MNTPDEPTKFGLFHFIDKFVFDLGENITQQEFYKKIPQTLDSLPEDQQSLVRRGIVVACTLIPFLPVLILSGVLFTVNKDLETKISVKTKIESITEILSVLNDKEKNFKKSSLYGEKGALERKIRQDLINVPASRFKVESLKLDSQTEQLSLVQANIAFQSMSSSQYLKLLKSLSVKNELSVTGLKIENDVKKSQLSGTINISYYVFSEVQANVEQ